MWATQNSWIMLSMVCFLSDFLPLRGKNIYFSSNRLFLRQPLPTALIRKMNKCFVTNTRTANSGYWLKQINYILVATPLGTISGYNNIWREV